MDIVTHALIGATAAAGWLPSQPELACGVVLGNVAPDLDAFSRLGGKQAFIRCHQTYTHSLAAMAAVLLVSVGLHFVSGPVWSMFVLGLAIGMVMHVGLDLTNSYGVQWAWPISRRRTAFDWIFFIDLPALILTIAALGLIGMFGQNMAMLPWVSGIYVGLLFVYVAMRSLIARRAQRLAKESDEAAERTAVIPTTWLPWMFLVCRDLENASQTFALNAITGQQSQARTVATFDAELPAAVSELIEWQAMRALSPYYHAVEQKQSSDEQAIVVRDLRIRNFDTRFGTLTCRLDAEGQIIDKHWEV